MKTVKAGAARTSSGVLEAIAANLENGDTWVAASSLSKASAPVFIPTLRSHLVRALGCDSRAGALAYWDWQEINALLGQCWAALAPVTGPAPELWSNAADRTVTQVIDALRSVPSDVPAPTTPFEPRPWSNPSVVRTCRIPFVPVVSVAHVWLAEQGPLRQSLDRLGVTEGSDPWDVLRAADPVARAIDPPADVRDVADAIRSWMVDQTPARYSPAKALCAAAEAFTSVPTASELAAWVQAPATTSLVFDDFVGG